MRKVFHTVTALAILVGSVGCASGGKIPKLAPNYSALSQAKSIYLGDFGGGNGTDLVKEKLRARLMSSQRFVVVETSDKADATLLGSAGVEKSQREGTTDYAGSGLLRLVDNRTQETIWAHEYTRGMMFGGSVSTRVANQMADALLHDANGPPLH